MIIFVAALAFCVIACLILSAFFACIGIYFTRKAITGRIQFMEAKDWKRVRRRLNDSHEETQVAVATDHLRGLLADE
ncbi:hypothetical protein [Allorhodopirellula heiligendammensis]|uniref:Uncharacterized protein n=1 Tax=Allorhodopirellula heiligendammensis TaxID=2714739 RepID=A0A5C6BYL9_9BACT|nr:hypothetical protein [Allorhodopirellula heiligendammensis]TWU15974.1 hypothetical protein Poly21_31780 [Allorhodopirellula heiligendammensis]